MATHDYVIDNQSAPAFRSDLNGALQAIVTNNSSATAPTTTYANMIWYDTANNQLKKRNGANSAWVILGTVDEAAGTFTPTGGPATQTQTVWNTGTSTAESTITPAKLNTKIENKLNVSGSAPMYACRAWVNFNGTWTEDIRGSGNVSSITDNGVGDYTVNFTTAMQDANYALVATVSHYWLSTNSSLRSVVERDTEGWRTASSVRLQTLQVNSGLASSPVDPLNVNVAIFR